MNPHSEPHEPHSDDPRAHGAPRPTTTAPPTAGAECRPPRSGQHRPGTGGDPAPPTTTPGPDPSRPPTPDHTPGTPTTRRPRPLLQRLRTTHRRPRRTPHPGRPHRRTRIPDAAASPPATPQVVLRGPAELADALPYLLGFYPTTAS
ncbi:hypothetical protein O1L55_38205 [Streptomyces albulus]|nr:hypothetical protein [Streptomyces noursei]